MGTIDRPAGTRFSEAWRNNRTYLVGLAFGMLGDIGAAEDAVQEAYARLAGEEFDAIEDARGWLTVVTSRICIDQIRSARSRREEAHEMATVEPAEAATLERVPMDPADRVTLDDEVRLALLVVLQRLSPVERVVFVLHDVFQVPFETIAETVGRPAPTCRQLARRARLKIGSEEVRGRVVVNAPEDRLVAERFIQACSNGDLSGLVQILDLDAWGAVDLGPGDPRSGVVVRGSQRVAANLLRFFGRATLACNPVGGHTIVLAFAGRALQAIMLITLDGGLIKAINVLGDPARIGNLNAQLSWANTPDEL
jgi:RNA polymerase sigma-70 factor (ECF subfamily)